MKKTYPYGRWPSPLDVTALTTGKHRLGDVYQGRDATFWLESLPEDNGFSTLMMANNKSQTGQKVLPNLPQGTPPFIGTKVHEMGGKAYSIYGSTIVFSALLTGQVYLYDIEAGGDIRALTPPDPLMRYGDFYADSNQVFAICEDHHNSQVRNYLVRLHWNDTPGYAQKEILYDRSDFVTSPALSPCGKFLAFISWNHPDLPWYHTRLHVMNISTTPYELTTVVDIDNVTVAQPLWADDGTLLHIDDSSGWANIYRTEGFNQPHKSDNPYLAWYHRLRTRALHPSNKDFMPGLFTLGNKSMAIFDADNILAAWHENGYRRVGLIRLDNGQAEVWPLQWQPSFALDAHEGRCAFIAQTLDHPGGLIRIDSGRIEILANIADHHIDYAETPPSSPKNPQVLTWQTTDGHSAHGYFYPPRLDGISAPEGEKPPLITMVHGGPTSAYYPGDIVEYQWWTSRGFAVFVPNYRGSTGYGRKYKNLLNGNWGVYDVADCVTGVQFLIEQGLVDPKRIAITGRSAGGYTTLMALATSDIFSAGCSHFGVSDIHKLHEETHKFESHYTPWLLGSDDTSDPVWSERSPIAHVDSIHAPLLLLQGEDDKIVPPNQSELMREALAARGVDVELIMFEGEGHGFVHDQTIRTAKLAELEFYRRVWGI